MGRNLWAGYRVVRRSMRRHKSQSLRVLIGSKNGDFWQERYLDDVFHHAARVTLLLCEAPAKAELLVEAVIFPLKSFLHGMTRAFRQADNGPKAAAERATATKAPTKEPFHVHRERFSENGIDAPDCGLELFRGDAASETGRKFRVEAIAQAEYRHISGASYDDRVRNCVVVVFSKLRLLLEYGIKVRRHDC